MADAVGLQGRNDRLVVEDLGHTAAQGDDPGGGVQQFLGRILIDSQGQIGLGQQQLGLSLEEQIAQLVGRIGAVRLLAADGDVEADGEPGKYLALLELRRYTNWLNLSQRHSVSSRASSKVMPWPRLAS